jgi:hypothetical protein
MTTVTPAVRADLAPTGTLRAGINYGNFILATRHRATGESSGVAIVRTDDIGFERTGARDVSLAPRAE